MNETVTIKASKSTPYVIELACSCGWWLYAREESQDSYLTDGSGYAKSHLKSIHRTKDPVCSVKAGTFGPEDSVIYVKERTTNG